MPTDVTVRPARTQDAAQISVIWNHYIRETAVTFNSVEKADTDVVTEIQQKQGAFWVAEFGGQVVGFATYGAFRGGIGYAQTKEHTIQLAPDFSGKGTGRALMNALMSHAKDNGVHSMWAGISAENTAGVAFHTAIGFDHVAVLSEVGHKFGRYMDLVLMQKFL